MSLRLWQTNINCSLKNSHLHGRKGRKDTNPKRFDKKLRGHCNSEHKRHGNIYIGCRFHQAIMDSRYIHQ